jgi:hypothetical protein
MRTSAQRDANALNGDQQQLRCAMQDEAYVRQGPERQSQGPAGGQQVAVEIRDGIVQYCVARQSNGTE